MSKQSDAYQAGIKVRAEVLGAAHVARSAVAEDDFSAPVQQFVTEVGWGNVWSRAVLDRKSRSMITVAMLAAIGSEHELSVHVRGALNNGVSRPELQEILLQAGLYAGAPAALAAFRIAKQTLQAIDNDAGRSDQGDAAQEGR